MVELEFVVCTMDRDRFPPEFESGSGAAVSSNDGKGS